ncbi:hypothetical protein [Mitsuokella sp. UBA4253]|uniref:hypothetical protein n=1 Tax=Mitsuokella sp. UBA4253 TaxID=1946959 RepID=UPI002579A2C5|nr:hypothetical protein [Mitsuokella sp. UBA4253]
MLQSLAILAIFINHTKHEKAQATIEYALILTFVVLIAVYLFQLFPISVETPEGEHRLIVQLSLSVKQVFIRVSDLMEKLPELP